MRSAVKEEKKIQSRILFILDPGKKIPKKKKKKKIKKLKNLFPALFLAKTGDEIGREIEKKILVPNSVHTRHRQENSKKNSKKIRKIKKPHSGIIFSQNGMRQAEKERKKFQTRILFILGPGKKIVKKIAKKFKKLKNLFPAFFLAKTG